MDASNPYAPPRSAVGDVGNGEQMPPLWNPNAATLWSLLCAPERAQALFASSLQSSCRPHSRLRPKKRVSSGLMPSSSRRVVCTSPIDT